MSGNGSVLSLVDLRRELHDLITADLLGPAGGEREVLPDPRERVSVRYLVGMLAPRGTIAFDPARHDSAAVDGDDAIADPAVHQAIGQIQGSSRPYNPRRHGRLGWRTYVH